MQRAVTWHARTACTRWGRGQNKASRRPQTTTKQIKQKGAPEAVICVMSEAEDLREVGVVVEEESQHPPPRLQAGEEGRAGGGG